MANRYIYSGAAGSGTGADWTNAHTTLAAAITASTAGDVFYVANDHSETQASAMTLTFKGSVLTPDRCICVNRAGSVPPVAADLVATPSAIVEVTGAFVLTIGGAVYCFGMNLRAGSGSSNAGMNFAGSAGIRQTFENCAFELNTTSTSSTFGTNNGTGSYITWTNCTVKFGSVSQGISGGLSWNNTAGVSAIAGAVIPTTLFKVPGTPIIISGLDLSAMGSGKSLMTSDRSPPVRMINCKLGSAVTTATTPANPNAYCDLIGCSSTTNVSRNERWGFQSTLTTETTIKRTGGASDGTTAYSWKIVSNANNKRDFPFETFEGVIWNDVTGSSKTLTVHVVTDNVTLTDADIWLEAEYLGSSATPVSTLVSDAAATPLTAGTNQASDSGTTWTTTGLTTPVKQSLDVTFTPQMAGPIRWRVKFAKASTTAYICPKADLV